MCVFSQIHHYEEKLLVLSLDLCNKMLVKFKNLMEATGNKTVLVHVTARYYECVVVLGVCSF